MQLMEFQKIVWKYYKKNGRKLPWRSPVLKLRKDKSLDLYKILVSEIMLQQTQVNRVIPKYKEFLKQFPTMCKLACAKRTDVLRAWRGLGYNRRALWLHRASQSLVKYPSSHKVTKDELNSLKGIGPNTATSICVFAYDVSAVFIETNIRTVFLKYFFQHKKNVSDTDILKVVKKTLPKKNIREWYWALMDVGSYIKKVEGNINRTQSKHYTRQSRFEGSKRQLRGRVLKEMLEKDFSPQNKAERKIYEELVREGFAE